MADDGLRNAHYWRDRAEEARLHAAEMTDPDARDAMYAIARHFDFLAERVAKFRRETKDRDPPR
jgi:hypothetical protein